MTNDLANCSKCWMRLEKMILKIPSKFSSKGQRWLCVEAEGRSDREGVYLGSISVLDRVPEFMLVP